MMPECPDCGERYSGTDASGGHCRGGVYGGCCRTFASDAAADAHRPVGGPCLDVATAPGWRLTARGWTNTPPMPPEVLERLRASRARS